MAKQKRVTATPCVLRTGTANSLSAWRQFDSEMRVRTAASKYFREQIEFASTRLGAAGADAVLLAIAEVNSAPINKEGVIVRCQLDPHTNFTIVAEMAKGTYDPKQKRVI